MQKFASVHPVISKIENLIDNNYLVYETLNFGFMSHSFTYPVRVESDIKKNRVVMNATVMKIINIEITFNLKTENGYTLVDEEVIFKPFLPIKTLMEKIFKKQHGLLFKNIGSL